MTPSKSLLRASCAAARSRAASAADFSAIAFDSLAFAIPSLATATSLAATASRHCHAARPSPTTSAQITAPTPATSPRFRRTYLRMRYADDSGAAAIGLPCR